MYQYIRLKPYSILSDEEEKTYDADVDASEFLYELLDTAMSEHSASGDRDMYIVHAARIERDGKVIFDKDQLRSIYRQFGVLYYKGTVGNSVNWYNYLREIVRVQAIIESDLQRNRARKIKSHYTDVSQLAQWRQEHE